MNQPEIYFYSGAPNKLHTACRLCAKAVQQDFKVLVYSQDVPLLNQFDKLLWTIAPTSFVPHCHAENIKLAPVSPVVLSDQVENNHDAAVLLNLNNDYPPAFEQFQRLIEIADQSNEGKIAARKRYRFYQDAGYTIHHHQIDKT